MNNSVLKGNVSHKNVLNMRQCGPCITYPQKHHMYKFRVLKMINISEQFLGSFFKSTHTSLSHQIDTAESQQVFTTKREHVNKFQI